MISKIMDFVIVTSTYVVFMSMIKHIFIDRISNSILYKLIHAVLRLQLIWKMFRSILMLTNNKACLNNIIMFVSHKRTMTNTKSLPFLAINLLQLFFYKWNRSFIISTFNYQIIISVF
jgi:hypothetical protein